MANGAKKRHKRKNIPTETATNPVFPPSLIPAPDSMYDVVLDVPNIEPTIVAIESEKTAFWIFSTFPFLSIFPDKLATDVRVPAVSKNQQIKL